MKLVKNILQLFSSNSIGRVLGLLKFQLLLYIFSPSEFTDSIIYYSSFLWIVNGFFITPIVNKSLIKELSISKEVAYQNLISKLTKQVIQFSIFIAIISYIFLLYFTPNNLLKLDLVTSTLIIFALPLLGVNEIFSLYNQFKEKYFLYAFNPVIWNITAIISLIFYWIFDIQNLWFYFLFLFLSKFISLLIQVYFSGLRIEMFKLDINSINYDFNLKKYYYSLSIIIFSSLTFIDLNLLGAYSFIGSVTIFSILIKLPILIQSLIHGSILPIFFNNIMFDKNKLKYNLNRFLAISVSFFLLLLLLYIIMPNIIFEFFFNFYEFSTYRNEAFIAIIYFIIANFAFFVIRLSVDFYYEKEIFVISIFTLGLKILISILFDIDFYLILITNIIMVISISIVGTNYLLKKTNNA